MPAYSDLYLDDIVEVQSQAFEMIRGYLPGVDEKWFIRKFMNSLVRRALDRGNAIYANKLAGEIIDDFIQEIGGNYKHGKSWGGFIPYWAGDMYARIQWKYNVKSSDLIDLITLEDIERYFVPLHQVDEWVAVDKIYQDIGADIDRLSNGDERI